MFYEYLPSTVSGLRPTHPFLCPYCAQCRGASLWHAGRVSVSDRPPSRVRRTRTELAQCSVPYDAGIEYFHRRMAHVPAPAPPGAATIGEFSSPDTVPPQSPGPTLDRESAGADIHEDVDHVSADSGCIAGEGTLPEHRVLYVAISEHFQDRASTGEEPNAETGSTSCLVFESEEIEPSLGTELQNVPQPEDVTVPDSRGCYSRGLYSCAHFRSQRTTKQG
jgi:hypothetical protein